MKNTRLKEWQNIKPKNLKGEILIKTVKNLDRINENDVVFHSPFFGYIRDVEKPTFKERLLDKTGRYGWFIDMDVEVEDLPNGLDFRRRFVPCLMHLDKDNVESERKEYMNYADVMGSFNDLTESSIEMVIDSEYDGFMTTLSLYATGGTSMLEGHRLDYDNVENTLDVLLNNYLNVEHLMKVRKNTPSERFLELVDIVSDHFPMRLEDFDELFGEKINQLMMMHRTLS